MEKKIHEDTTPGTPRTLIAMLCLIGTLVGLDQIPQRRPEPETPEIHNYAPRTAYAPQPEYKPLNETNYQSSVIFTR